MLYCPNCHSKMIRSSFEAAPEAANDNIPVLYVRNNRELLRPENITRIAMELRDIPYSSRAIINWVADALFIRFDGIILWPNGEEFEIGDEDLDRIFATPTASRWLRSVRQFAGRPAKQTAPVTLAERYRYLDVALQAEAFVAKRKRL